MSGTLEIMKQKYNEAKNLVDQLPNSDIKIAMEAIVNCLSTTTLLVKDHEDTIISINEYIVKHKK